MRKLVPVLLALVALQARAQTVYIPLRSGVVHQGSNPPTNCTMGTSPDVFVNSTGCMWYCAGPAGPNAGTYTAAPCVAGIGASTSTIREVDASPSVGGVTTIEFDQGVGLTVTDQGSGVARVSIGTLPDSVIPDNVTVEVAATANALTANGSNCPAGQAAAGVSASGVAEGCADLGAISGTRQAIAAVTGGAGTSSATAYTGWETAITAGPGRVLLTGGADGSLRYYDVPDAGISIPSNVAIIGDGNAILTWGTARASVNPMLKIPVDATNVTIEGLRFEPGVTVPTCGMADATGGGSFIETNAITAGHNVSNVRITGNKFGIMRYSDGGGGCGGGTPFGVSINIVGSATNLSIDHNTFDTSVVNIFAADGTNSTQYTIDYLSIHENTFNWSQADASLGQAIAIGEGASSLTVPVNVQHVSITNNRAFNFTSGIIVRGNLDYCTISGNNLTSLNMNGCIWVVHPYGLLPDGINYREPNKIAITGNVCSAGTSPLNRATAGLGGARIRISNVEGFSVTGNTLYGGYYDIGESHNGTVSGNAAEGQSGTTAHCIRLFGSSDTTVIGNTCRNATDTAIYDENAAGTPYKNILIIGNNIFDEKNPSLGGGISMSTTCTNCLAVGNIQHTVTDIGPPAITSSSLTQYGNMGFVNGVLKYGLDFTGLHIGTFKGTSATTFTPVCIAGSNVGATCALDTDCPSSKCSADLTGFAANTALYGGDGINSEGSVGETANGVQKNGHIRYPNWLVGSKEQSFADGNGFLALTDGTCSGGPTPGAVCLPQQGTCTGGSNDGTACVVAAGGAVCTGGGTCTGICGSGGTCVSAGAVTSAPSANAFFLGGFVPVNRGGHGSAPTGDDYVFIADSGSAGTWRVIADCVGAGKALTYTASTNTLGCNTIPADVIGPSSATADELAAFNGAGGKTIKPSGILRSGLDTSFPGSISTGSNADGARGYVTGLNSVSCEDPVGNSWTFCAIGAAATSKPKFKRPGQGLYDLMFTDGGCYGPICCTGGVCTLQPTGIAAGSCTNCNCSYGADGRLLSCTNGSGGGVTQFKNLTDVPNTYVGQANKVPSVNVGETGLNYVDTLRVTLTAEQPNDVLFLGPAAAWINKPALLSTCGTVSMNPPSTARQATGLATATVTGLTATDTCSCTARTDFDDDIIQKACFGTANTLNLRFYVASGASSDPLDAAAQTVDYCCFTR